MFHCRSFRRLFIIIYGTRQKQYVCGNTFRLNHPTRSIMASLVLPSNYAYVALAAAGTLWLNIFQVMTVSKARKAVCSFPDRTLHSANAASSLEARPG